MEKNWIADVVGRMHVAKITGQQLAKACGYSASYLSSVLSGVKGCEETQKRICAALEKLEGEKRSDTVSGGIGDADTV